MSPIRWLLASFVLQSLSDASHFRGATIQWSPVYDTSAENQTVFTGVVQITHQISWTRSSAEGGNCDNSVIQSQRLLGGGFGLLVCRAGCTGIVGPMDYFCTDYNALNNWSTGKRSYEYDSSGVQVYEASFASGNWEALVMGGGNWELRLKFNLTERDDTGRVNTSPNTIFFPDLQHQHGCNQTIRIPVIDDDGDVVRCRWSTGNECAGVCMVFPGTLNQEECTIEYSANVTQGLYAVAIQVEDFATAGDTKPLSSVPVQFLVRVTDLGVSCSDLIEFVGNTPSNGACFGVGTNQTLKGCITARHTIGSSITAIQTVSPRGLQRTDVMMLNGTQDYFIEYVWTPDPGLFGPQLFCFSARDSLRASSSQVCITLIAGASAPLAVFDSLSPRGLINQTELIEWSMQFDLPFVRPSSSAFIRVFAEDGEEVASIDVSLSDSVFYPDTRISQTLRFTTNFTAVEGTMYHVLFEPGVGVTNNSCPTNSHPIDDLMLWTVTIMVHDPCLEGPCDSNANCMQLHPLTSNFTCECKPGFLGDGLFCYVPDPCTSVPCDVNAECVREDLLNALFTCTCMAPFEGSGLNCTIPSPCLSGPCDINATCVREGLLSTNFTCTCQEPFTGDGFNCTVPDPCLFTPCHERATCTRQGLRTEEFQCECDPGYFGDGLNCTVSQRSPSTVARDVAVGVATVIAIVAVVVLIGAVYGYFKVLSHVAKAVKGATDTKTLL